MALNFKAGDKVVVDGKHSGTVRWQGTVEGSDGVRFGIELDHAGALLGATDGTWHEKKLFTCPEDTGVLVGKDRLAFDNAKSAAATRIQALFRGRQVRQESGLLSLQRTWTALEDHEELMTTHMEDQLDQLEQLVQKRAEKAQKQGKTIRNRPEIAKTRLQIPDDFKGTKLKLPLGAEDVKKLVQAFKSGEVLHYKYAFAILSGASGLFRSTNESLQYVPVPDKGHVTVVGDLHSQVFDLLTILEMQGLPSDDHVYVFNGDFVDRGPAGCEVVFLLYALKAVWPRSVFLNRGNHEARKINEKYDFEAEVIKKYDAALFELFQDTFCYLPVAAVIGESVLVLHGGLFKNDKITLKDIREMKYRGQPKSGTKDKELQILEPQDILWSDPKPAMSGRRSSSRGAGVWFGADVTRDFLERNHLKMLIRSHELVADGYQFLHDNLALTVFSASNYCGKSMNKAAFVVLRGDLKPHCTNYMVDESKFQVASSQLQQDVIARVSDLVFAQRYELAKRFTIYDKAESGTLPRVKWAKAMTKVLGVDIPWLSLQPLICPATEDGSIAYIKFLEQYRISGMEAAVEEAILSKIAAKFLAFGPSLKDAFRELDQDGSGSISYKELVEALNGLNVGITKPGLYDLMRTLDTNSDNLITYEEFQSRFEVHFNRIKKLGDRDQWAYKKLRQIGTKLYQLAGASDADRALETLFEEVDTDKNGHLDTQEFATFIKTRLEMNVSDAKLARLIRLIDENGDGVIDYREFVKTFKVFDSGNTQWQQEVLQRLYSTLLKNKTQLRKAFKLFDVNCDGKISAEEFRIGIEALNDTLPAEEQITALQARELFAAIRDKDDCIDYEKFLESFSVEVAPPAEQEEDDPRVAEVDALLADDKPTRQIRRVQRQPSSLAMYSAEIRAGKT